MLSNGIIYLTEFLNTLRPEFIWGMLLIFCFGSILLLLRTMGKLGLYIYVTVAIIAANIQVLKAVKFGFFSEPVALGTILFASTYLATDILVEHYGVRAGRRAVWSGFVGFTLMTFLMIFTISFQPLDVAVFPEWQWAIDNHSHISAVFTPAPSLLIAGMSAYLCSQLLDIFIFQKMKEKTKGRMLWLRNNTATIIASLVDNTIFSILAWRVFAESPLDWHIVIFTYILGTFVLRVFVALLDTPFLYLSRYCLPKNRED